MSRTEELLEQLRRESVAAGIRQASGHVMKVLVNSGVDAAIRREVSDALYELTWEVMYQEEEEDG